MMRLSSRQVFIHLNSLIFSSCFDAESASNGKLVRKVFVDYLEHLIDYGDA